MKRKIPVVASITPTLMAVTMRATVVDAHISKPSRRMKRFLQHTIINQKKEVLFVLAILSLIA